jgi:hypothetical protein
MLWWWMALTTVAPLRSGLLVGALGTGLSMETFEEEAVGNLPEAMGFFTMCPPNLPTCRNLPEGSGNLMVNLPPAPAPLGRAGRQTQFAPWQDKKGLLQEGC